MPYYMSADCGTSKKQLLIISYDGSHGGNILPRLLDTSLDVSADGSSMIDMWEEQGFCVGAVDKEDICGYASYCSSLIQYYLSILLMEGINYSDPPLPNFGPYLQYVLILGDVTGSFQVPSFLINSHHNYEEAACCEWGGGGVCDDWCPGGGLALDVTDFPYSYCHSWDELDECDPTKPKFAIGRWSFQQLSYLENIITRNIHYRKNISNSSMDKALVVAANWPQDQVVSNTRTSDWIADEIAYWGMENPSAEYQGPWGPVPCSGKVYFDPGVHECECGDDPGGWCTYKVEQIWNDGVGLVTYRGWADVHGWHYPFFHAYNIGELQAWHNMPIVLSMGCNTADFYNNYEDMSFGEVLLFAGSSSNPRGAVAVIGPSDLDTDTRFNNIFGTSLVESFLNSKYEKSSREYYNKIPWGMGIGSDDASQGCDQTNCPGYPDSDAWEALNWAPPFPSPTVHNGYLEYSDDYAVVGEYSLKHTATGPDSYTNDELFSPNTSNILGAAAAGQTWTFSASCKSAGDGVNVQLWIMGLKSDGHWISTDYSFAPRFCGPDWTEMADVHTFTDPNVFGVSIRVDNEGGNGSVVYWDNLKLIQIGPSEDQVLSEKVLGDVLLNAKESMFNQFKPEEFCDPNGINTCASYYSHIYNLLGDPTLPINSPRDHEHVDPRYNPAGGLTPYIEFPYVFIDSNGGGTGVNVDQSPIEYEWFDLSTYEGGFGDQVIHLDVGDNSVRYVEFVNDVGSHAFNFKYFGREFWSIRVTSNGLIHFEKCRGWWESMYMDGAEPDSCSEYGWFYNMAGGYSDNMPSFPNLPPVNAFPEWPTGQSLYGSFGRIAPFWHDYKVVDGSPLDVWVYKPAGQKKMYVQYRVTSGVGNQQPPPIQEFQVLFNDDEVNPTTGNGTITFYYKSVYEGLMYTGIHGTTIGITSPDNAVGIDYLHAHHYHSSVHSPEWEPGIQWIDVHTDSGNWVPWTNCNERCETLTGTTCLNDGWHGEEVSNGCPGWQVWMNGDDGWGNYYVYGGGPFNGSSGGWTPYQCDNEWGEIASGESGGPVCCCGGPIAEASIGSPYAQLNSFAIKFWDATDDWGPPFDDGPVCDTPCYDYSTIYDPQGEDYGYYVCSPSDCYVPPSECWCGNQWIDGVPWNRQATNVCHTCDSWNNINSDGPAPWFFCAPCEPCPASEITPELIIDKPGKVIGRWNPSGMLPTQFACMLDEWPDEPILLFTHQAVCSDYIHDYSGSSCAPFDCPEDPVPHSNPCTDSCCTEGNPDPKEGDTCIVRAWTGQLGWCEEITNAGNTLNQFGNFMNDYTGSASWPKWHLGAWNICIGHSSGGQDPSNDNLWNSTCPTVEMELQGPTH